MNAAKLEKIFRDRFDEVIRLSTHASEVLALQAGFDEWNRWLGANRVKARPLDTIYRHDPKKLTVIKDPTGFRMLFVPTDLAEKALVLGFLP